MNWTSSFKGFLARGFFPLLCILLGTTLVAQNDNAKVNALIDRSATLQNPREALSVLVEAQAFKNSIDDSLQAVLYLKTGILYSKLYANDSALLFFDSALRITSSHDHWNLLEANILNYQGNVSRSLSDPESAMMFYNNGLAAVGGLSSREAFLLQSKLLGNIGGIYYDLNDFNKALEYAERGRDVSLKNHLEEHYQMDYLLVGFAARAAGQYQKALENNKEALRMILANKDSSYLAHTFYNIASLQQINGQSREALENFDKAIQFASLFGEHEVRISCLISKAQLFMTLKDPEKAYALAMEAEGLAIVHTFLPKLIEALEIQYKAHNETGNYQRAFEIQNRYLVFKDSMYKVQTRESLDEIETRYETSKKEQTIRELEQQNEIKDLQAEQDLQLRYGLFLLAGLLALVLGLLFNRYRLKQRNSDMLNTKNIQLQEANAFKDRLVATISHDLKSPLSAFQTLTSSLSHNLPVIGKEQLAGFIDELNASSKEIYSTLNNLLSWAITQTGSMTFHPHDFNIKALAEEVVTQSLSLLNQKQIQCSIHINHPCVAFGDENMIQIVMRNLLANAIKFSSRKGIIRLTAEKKNDHVIVSVNDQGIGIRKEDLHRLFRMDQDVQTIGNAPEKGTGIGLLLCQELIVRHHGKIWVESEEGKGSTFYFSLPDEGS